MIIFLHFGRVFRSRNLCNTRYFIQIVMASKTVSPKKDSKIKDGKDEEFLFFYGKDHTFSQFHSAKFTVDGIKYNCMEQYMHHQKAVVFKDDKIAKQILATSDPKTQKKLGRQVSNFDKAVWAAKSIEVVTKGNVEKYRQNPVMLKELLSSYPKTIVEASPRDRLWGIGMGKDNPKARDRTKWRGKNLLGKCLEDVRTILMKEKKKEKGEGSERKEEKEEKKTTVEKVKSEGKEKTKKKQKGEKRKIKEDDQEIKEVESE